MLPTKGITRICFPISPIFRTFLGDFSPQQLPSRRLQTLWEWKNRVLLEEYYIFNVAIPLEVQREQSYEPSSHYYLRSLCWTSRIFSFPDSRDLLEVLGGLVLAEREGGGP